jgi:glutathione S-transferase
MAPRLYVILGSHACRAGMLLLAHKGIAYERVTLPTGWHPFLLRVAGFSANPEPFRRLGDTTTRSLERFDRMGTVPTLAFGEERIKTNREIARFLDRVQPDPPLFPSDPARRAAVEEAERWGDDVLQMVARRLGLAAAYPRLERMVNHGDDGRLGPILWRGRLRRRAGMRMVGRFFHAGPAAEARMLAELPPMLDRIDTWIAEGVLNAAALTAADHVIAPSLALLGYRRDLRDELERRPLGRLVDRLLPAPPTVEFATHD